ncbi:MAG TPA: type II toxin-antitoxin system RelE/ParE family toxin [bacterium]|nr:type II toxin-antitoxin system RelE/ParE family toxin [bacterium]
MEEFLDSLSVKAARKVTWVLKLLEEIDIVPAEYFKKLHGSQGICIWECRVTFGSNSYRILCFFTGHDLVVLTHGFSKKSRKTPAREIERAEAYRKDYLERRKEK